jgi:hypothetical protein
MLFASQFHPRSCPTIGCFLFAACRSLFRRTPSARLKYLELKMKSSRLKIASGFVIAMLVMGWTNSMKAQGALTPVDLRCALRVNPLGIGDANPRLSWQLQSTGQGSAYRGEVQSAYQIQVGSSAGAADLWDSGEVVSSQTVDVVYAGQALTSGATMFLAGTGLRRQ